MKINGQSKLTCVGEFLLSTARHIQANETNEYQSQYVTSRKHVSRCI